MEGRGLVRSKAPYDIDLISPSDFRAAYDEFNGDSKIWAALQARWIWQDQLMWSRTQMLLAVQAAALAAGHSLRGSHGAVLLVVGALLSATLLRLAWVDERDRDRVGALMDAVIRTNLPADPAASARAGWYLSGGGMLKVVLSLFVLGDILYAAYLIFGVPGA
jgi:hypothetical protein